MAIDYLASLSSGQKQVLLTERIRRFTVEAYQHQLNRQVAEAISDSEGVANADAALATIETAITVYQEEMDAL